MKRIFRNILCFLLVISCVGLSIVTSIDSNNKKKNGIEKKKTFYMGSAGDEGQNFEINKDVLEDALINFTNETEEEREIDSLNGIYGDAIEDALIEKVAKI